MNLKKALKWCAENNFYEIRNLLLLGVVHTPDDPDYKFQILSVCLDDDSASEGWESCYDCDMFYIEHIKANIMNDKNHSHLFNLSLEEALEKLPDIFNGVKFYFYELGSFSLYESLLEALPRIIPKVLYGKDKQGLAERKDFDRLSMKYYKRVLAYDGSVGELEEKKELERIAIAEIKKLNRGVKPNMDYQREIIEEIRKHIETYWGHV